MITATYYGVLLIVSAAGIALLEDRRWQSFRTARARFLAPLRNKVFWQDRFSGVLFEETGCELSRKAYESIRLALLVGLTLAGFFSREGSVIAAAFIAYAATEPLERIGGVTLPFGYLCGALRKSHIQKKDMEIYEAMAFLKNIAVSGRNSQYGADFIIEQLAGYGELLKPIYFNMLKLLRINRKEEAIEYFAKEVGTKTGRDFGRLLIQMDELTPGELEETLRSHQKTIREVRTTRQKQQDETVSDLLYLPVVVNVLLIFINFIYISYFIEQKNMFGVLIN